MVFEGESFPPAGSFKCGADHSSISAALDAVNAAAELRIRAERRMGEALRDSERGQGRRSDLVVQDDQVAKPTLAEIGITKDQSSRYQAIAAIPKATFETAIEAHKAADEPLSAAAVVRVAETLDSLPEPIREDVVASGPDGILTLASESFRRSHG